MNTTLLTAVAVCGLAVGSQAAISVDVLSQGFEVGFETYARVDGVDLLDTSTFPFVRGFNILVLDPSSGSLKATGNFDFWGAVDADPSHTVPPDTLPMETFINNINTGDIVIVVTADTPIWGCHGCDSHLPSSVVQALMTLGAPDISPDSFRSAYALIGHKGDDPATAEAFGYEVYPSASVHLTALLELDADLDGVPDVNDECPNTPSGEIVNSNGCSISQLVPASGEWSTHGKYLSAVARMAEEFLAQGLITIEQKDAIVSSAAKSKVGK
jgi:hypothetical protein